MIDQLAAAHDLRHRVEVAAIVLVEFGIGRHVDQFAAEQAVAADHVVAHRQIRRSARWLPRKPAMPVMKMRMRPRSRSAHQRARNA